MDLDRLGVACVSGREAQCCPVSAFPAGIAPKLAGADAAANRCRSQGVPTAMNTPPGVGGPAVGINAIDSHAPAGNSFRSTVPRSMPHTRERRILRTSADSTATVTARVPSNGQQDFQHDGRPTINGGVAEALDRCMRSGLPYILRSDPHGRSKIVSRATRGPRRNRKRPSPATTTNMGGAGNQRLQREQKQPTQAGKH